MLPKEARLRRNREFRRIYARGRSAANALLVVHALPNRAGAQRFGFSVGKKLGDAVYRNRVRRRLREAVRARLVRLAPRFDVVIVARSKAREADWPALCAALDDVLRRGGLLIAPNAPEK